MKKLLPVLIVIAVVSAAAWYFIYGSKKPEPVPPGAPEIFLPNFDASASAKMGAYMNNGCFLINDEYIFLSYGDMLRWRQDHKVVNGDFVRLPKEEIKTADIAEGKLASYLNEGLDKALYYINEKREIERMPIGGDEHKKISGAGIQTLQVEGGKLYYSKGDDSRFFRAGLDGKGEEKILDKEVYYPYVVGNFVVYQDDKDGESIHLYNMNERRDVKILDGRALCPNIVGNWLFCYVQNAETKFSQIVGVEFKASGEFEKRIFNRDDSFWYEDMRSFHYEIRQSGGGEGYGALVFFGKNVLNFGRDSQKIDGEMFFGALPAWLLYNPRFQINGTLNYVYSSEYGYVQNDNGQTKFSYFDKLHNFDGFYEKGSKIERDVEEWKAKSEDAAK
jgi:hypothetical protein